MPCALAEVVCNAPSAAFIDAARASPLRLANFGSAVAARMPRITITTINSISVKPAWACLRIACIVCLFIQISKIVSYVAERGVRRFERPLIRYLFEGHATGIGRSGRLGKGCGQAKEFYLEFQAFLHGISKSFALI